MTNKYFDIKEKHNRWEGIRKSITGERLKVTIHLVELWDGTEWDIKLYKFYKGRYEFVRRDFYKDIDDGVEYLVDKCINLGLIKDFVSVEKLSQKTFEIPIITFDDDDDNFYSKNGCIYPKEVMLKAIGEYAERTNLNMRLVGKMIKADIDVEAEKLNLDLNSTISMSCSISEK